jgi:hypothetical protein
MSMYLSGNCAAWGARTTRSSPYQRLADRKTYCMHCGPHRSLACQQLVSRARMPMKCARYAITFWPYHRTRRRLFNRYTWLLATRSAGWWNAQCWLSHQLARVSYWLNYRMPLGRQAAHQPLSRFAESFKSVRRLFLLKKIQHSAHMPNVRREFIDPLLPGH